VIHTLQTAFEHVERKENKKSESLSHRTRQEEHHIRVDVFAERVVPPLLAAFVQEAVAESTEDAAVKAGREALAKAVESLFGVDGPDLTYSTSFYTLVYLTPDIDSVHYVKPTFSNHACYTTGDSKAHRFHLKFCRLVTSETIARRKHHSNSYPLLAVPQMRKQCFLRFCFNASYLLVYQIPS
jgi:hypothetical protein